MAVRHGSWTLLNNVCAYALTESGRVSVAPFKMVSRFSQGVIVNYYQGQTGAEHPSIFERHRLQTLHWALQLSFERGAASERLCLSFN